MVKYNLIAKGNTFVRRKSRFCNKIVKVWIITQVIEKNSSKMLLNVVYRIDLSNLMDFIKIFYYAAKF